MRPLKLTVEGLRSFRAPESIDFTGRDHVAIVGDTGAGKSSILEAITYALYGQTTFASQVNQELMNDTSTHLRVVLRFRVSGETWEVARTLRRGGQGDVGQVRALLRSIDDDDATVEQIEQVRRVNERIEDLLGLDSSAFLRTVVLPQGRFARLLVEDEPGVRSQILRQVWRTDELEEAGTLAGQARQGTHDLRVRLEHEASLHPEDPERHLEKLQEAFAEARDLAAAASGDERAAITARVTVLAAEEVQQTASGVIERMRALDTEGAARRLAPIAAIERQLGEEEAVLKQRQENLEDELARIPSDDGPTSGEVAAALTALGGMGRLVADSENASRGFRAADKAASRKHAHAQHLTYEAERAGERAEGHAEKRGPLTEAVDSAQERRTEVDQKYSLHEERGTVLDEARKQLEMLRTEEAACVQRLESAQEEERRASGTAAEAQEHLEEARRSESAASAAHGLHSGDECPICRRDLPGDWEPPEGALLNEAEQIAEASRQAARQAEQAVTRLGTEQAGIERQIADSEDRFAGARTMLTEARQELARHVDFGEQAPVPKRGALLAPFESACTEAEGRLAEHERETEELRLEATRKETAATVARTEAANAGKLVEHARTAAGDALERLREAVRTVPPAYRPSLDLPDDPADLVQVDASPVDAQTDSARERAQVLAERDSERQRLEVELADVRNARSVLESRRGEEVEAPLEEIVRDLTAHRDVLVESVSRLGLEAEVPPVVYERDVEALQGNIDALRAMTAEAVRAANRQLQEASDRVVSARAELAAIAERLDPELDVRDLDAIVETAGNRANDAGFQERRTRESADRFSAIIDDVLGLRALLAEVEERERALADLEDALKPGAFLKWLTLRRSRRLLVHASRLLDEMSAGKYAFVDPGETEERWRVLDRDSGQARSPASLSGGEQFIASLSLALGMVEMMARSGGRLESLFLDEGFGSLDRNNLDAAIQALGTVAARGRMVGVISHVRAVAEQIDHVLAVTRDATGTRTRWLTGTQRQQLAESDTAWEAASALGGLLD